MAVIAHLELGIPEPGPVSVLSRLTSVLLVVLPRSSPDIHFEDMRVRLIFFLSMPLAALKSCRYRASLPYVPDGSCYSPLEGKRIDYGIGESLQTSGVVSRRSVLVPFVRNQGGIEGRRGTAAEHPREKKNLSRTIDRQPSPGGGGGGCIGRVSLHRTRGPQVGAPHRHSQQARARRAGSCSEGERLVPPTTSPPRLFPHPERERK